MSSLGHFIICQKNHYTQFLQRKSYSQHSLLFTYIWKMHYSVLSGLEKIYSLSANWFITPFKGSHDFELLGNYLSAAKYQQYTRRTVATSFASAILQLVFTAIKMNIILDPYAESQLSLVWRHFQSNRHMLLCSANAHCRNNLVIENQSQKGLNPRH